MVYSKISVTSVFHQCSAFAEEVSLIMAKCQLCGKKPSFGNNVSHAHNLTRRMWKPNIQKATLTLDGGVSVQMKLCTKCLRTVSKAR
jgi:large subunit ribosomal protein L28